jgi:ElaB/YqjD/DUF883 family membrane-anchored ribosome-binding protein
MSDTTVDKTIRAARSAIRSTTEAASDGVDHAEHTLSDAARRIEKAVTEGVEQIRNHTKAYASEASDHIDDAQRYVAGRVRERPMTATGIAVGVGVLIGLLLATGRNR